MEKYNYTNFENGFLNAEEKNNDPVFYGDSTNIDYNENDMSETPDENIAEEPTGYLSDWMIHP